MENVLTSPALLQVKLSLPWTLRQRLWSLCQDAKRMVFPLFSCDLINNTRNVTALQPCEQVPMDLPSTQVMLSHFRISYFLFNAQISTKVIAANERWFWSPPTSKSTQMLDDYGRGTKHQDISCCHWFYCRMISGLLQYCDSVSPYVTLEFIFWEETSFSF